jgi:murein L,D-transpeptidase YafK
MGSGVSIAEADKNAVVDSSFSFDSTNKEPKQISTVNIINSSTADIKSSSSSSSTPTISMTKSSHAAFIEHLKRRTDNFLKESLTSQIDVSEIRYFLNNPSSMQLFKRYLKERAGTVEAAQLLEVNAVC